MKKISTIQELKGGVLHYGGQALLNERLKREQDQKVRVTYEPYRGVESQDEREFFEAGMIPTFAEYVYPDRSPLKQADIDFVREDIKKEFNGVSGTDMHGNYVKLPRTSKGSVKELLTLCSQYLMENGYPIPNTELWKKWDSEFNRAEGNYWLWLRKNNLRVDGLPLSL